MVIRGAGKCYSREDLVDFRLLKSPSIWVLDGEPAPLGEAEQDFWEIRVMAVRTSTHISL
jgi:hypothetical protein